MIYMNLDDRGVSYEWNVFNMKEVMVNLLIDLWDWSKWTA